MLQLKETKTSKSSEDKCGRESEKLTKPKGQQKAQAKRVRGHPHRSASPSWGCLRHKPPPTQFFSCYLGNFGFDFYGVFPTQTILLVGLDLKMMLCFQTCVCAHACACVCVYVCVHVYICAHASLKLLIVQKWGSWVLLLSFQL